MNTSFEDIRPLYDSEVPAAIERLLKEESVYKLINYVYPDKSKEEVAGFLKGFNTVKDFQRQFLYPLTRTVANRTTDDLSFSGLENISSLKSHLIISNHRDIILDSSFLNMILGENDYETVQNAIGSNLLIFPWIEDLVKLNQSFIVKRNIPVKQLVESSHILSSYIRTQISENRSSIWIAQREGRSKDGSDKTQPSLLKMFGMSSAKSFEEAYEELNITPLCLSYEWDPCDLMKISEVYKKLNNITYKKSPQDDLTSMLTGISGYKGRVHLSIGAPVKEELKEIVAATTNKNDQYRLLAETIDRKIHSLYKIYPNNYVAYDVLNNSDEHAEFYSKDVKEKFLSYVEEKISKVESDKDAHKQLLIRFYSYPLINKKNASS